MNSIFLRLSWKKCFFSPNRDHCTDDMDIVSAGDEENLGSTPLLGLRLTLTDVRSLDAFTAFMDLIQAHSFISISLQTIRRRVCGSSFQHS